MSDYVSGIKAGILALMVAALIWIWAEGESLQQKTLSRVEVSLPTDLSGELVIRPDDQTWNGTLQVRLEGAVRAVEAAASVLAQRAILSPGLAGMPKEPGEFRTVDFREALRDLPEMAPYRGVVAEIEPPTLTVRVVRMATRDLPVRVDVRKDAPLDGEPAPSPATVRLRMPEDLAKLLPESAVVLAIVPDEALARLRGDGPQTITVPVRLPEAVAGQIAPGKPNAGLVTIVPETIAVSVRPRRAVDSLVLPNVPVWYSLPPTEDGGKWTVEVLDKFLADVTVAGSSEEVARVSSGVLAIKANVELTSDDLEKAAAGKGEFVDQAVFAGVPPGLTCTVANPTVRIKVSRRNGAAEPVPTRPTP